MRTESYLLVVFLLFSQSILAKDLIPVEVLQQDQPGLTIHVQDELGPLSQARVFIETSEGQLLTEGETKSDGTFIAQLSSAVVASKVTITAYSQQHTIVSVIENIGHVVKLFLPTLPTDEFAMMKGLLNGFDPTHQNDEAKVGFIAKALELSDLVQLDTSSFISPLKDTIDVFGSREIPSNLVLPEQTFYAYLLPIYVNKPHYRLPLNVGSRGRYFGVSGVVNVEKAVSAFRSNNAWAIIDMVEFKKIGTTREIRSPAVGQEVEVDVNTGYYLFDRVRLNPSKNVNTETKRLAVALWETQTGIYIPSDIKQVKDEAIDLKAVNQYTVKLLDLILTPKGDRFRGAWLAQGTTKVPDADLSIKLDFKSLDGAWNITGLNTAQLMIVHLEQQVETSIKSKRILDQWVLVGPRSEVFRLPSIAFKSLNGKLGTISHVAVDLIETESGGYPFINGKQATKTLKVLEKAKHKIATLY